MSWGLAILLIIIFVCFTALLYLQIKDFNYFFETYFIIVILILFVILIFTIDFNNPISTTIYIAPTAVTEKTLIYNVPYNADDSFSNLMSASFAGTWTGHDPVNSTAANDTLIFNYDTFASTTLLSGAITLTKLPNHQIQVDINPVGNALNGYLNLTLLCTGSQNIDGSFDLQE